MQTVKERVKPEIQAMAEAYRSLSVPGAPHKQLAKLEGSWDIKGKTWMDPGQPPMEFNGTSEQRMILDGRFLHSESKSVGNNLYAGINILGYDNHTRQYVAANLNSMSTGIYLLTGSAGADGKTITMSYDYNEPVVGPTHYRVVVSIKDDDHFAVETYATGKRGTEMKVMESDYTRKQ